MKIKGFLRAKGIVSRAEGRKYKSQYNKIFKQDGRLGLREGKKAVDFRKFTVSGGFSLLLSFGGSKRK